MIQIGPVSKKGEMGGAGVCHASSIAGTPKLTAKIREAFTTIHV